MELAERVNKFFFGDHLNLSNFGNVSMFRKMTRVYNLYRTTPLSGSKSLTP